MYETLCSIAETYTMLYINYTSMKKNLPVKMEGDNLK